MKQSASATIDEYILQEWRFEDSHDKELQELTEIIRRWARDGNWLDLGCGPLLTVWPMFVRGEVSIFGCDRNSSVASFHAALQTTTTETLPHGLRSAVSYCNANFGTAFANPPIDRIAELIIDSITKAQPHWNSLFNTVVQIGCFGCLDSIQDLKQALVLVERYLCSGGIFISETWVPQTDHIDSVVWGGNNLRTLSIDTFSLLVESAGMRILMKTVTAMQTHYKERFIVVAEKKR